MNTHMLVVTGMMNKEETGIPREFILKQIENEITAGFALVAEARRALKLSQPGTAEDALEKAAETHQQILKEVTDSPVAQVRMVTHQLSELREAIDWLRETYLEQRTTKG